MGQIGDDNVGPLCPVSYVSRDFIVLLDCPSRRRPFQEFFPNLTVAPRCCHWNSLHRDRFVVYGMATEENEYAYINDLWGVSLPLSPNLGLLSSVDYSKFFNFQVFFPPVASHISAVQRRNTTIWRVGGTWWIVGRWQRNRANPFPHQQFSRSALAKVSGNIKC